MHAQAYMMRLGTFGFRDMKDLIGALNRYVSAPSRVLLRKSKAVWSLQNALSSPLSSCSKMSSFFKID